jgi:hypothetical protein
MLLEVHASWKNGANKWLFNVAQTLMLYPLPMENCGRCHAKEKDKLFDRFAIMLGAVIFIKCRGPTIMAITSIMVGRFNTCYKLMGWYIASRV